MKRWPPKDPDEIADYALDWSARLAGDAIAQSSWIVPVGLTKGDQANGPTMALLWLGGGVVGKTYDILNRVTTAGGRTFDQTVRLRIKTK